VAKTTAAIAAAWQKGMAAAGPAFAAGTGATTLNPMALAAQAGDKAVANYTAAWQSGQVAAALNAVPVSYWKSQCAAAGPRLASGATKALPKYTAAINSLQPVWTQMKAASDAAGTDPGSRAAAAINVLVASGKKGRAMRGG
jgi:hypothetical protein